MEQALIDIFTALGWQNYTQVVLALIPILIATAAGLSAVLGDKDAWYSKAINTVALNVGKAKNDPAVQ